MYPSTLLSNRQNLIEIIGQTGINLINDFCLQPKPNYLNPQYQYLDGVFYYQNQSYQLNQGFLQEHPDQTIFIYHPEINQPWERLEKFCRRLNHQTLTLTDIRQILKSPKTDQEIYQQVELRLTNQIPNLLQLYRKE